MTPLRLVPLPPAGGNVHWTTAVRQGPDGPENVAMRVRHVEPAIERVEQSAGLRLALLAMAIERPR